MALYIKLAHIKQPLELHVPISLELADDIVKRSHEVVSISADGHEHELIVQRFVNLPHGHASTKWYEPFARFIAVTKVIFTACPILERLGGVGEVAGLRVVGFI